MQASWQRWIPLTGILFVVLFVIAFIVGTGPDDTNMTDTQLLAWYADHGHRVMMIAGAYLFAFASVCMILFANRLRSLIHTAEGGNPQIATAVFAGGIVFAAGLAIGAAAIASVPAAISIGGEPMPTGADVIRFVPSTGFGSILVTTMLSAILMILGTAFASMRYGLFPTWFNWLSVICGIALLFSVAFFPLIALGIWMLVASVLLLQRQPAAVTTT